MHSPAPPPVPVRLGPPSRTIEGNWGRLVTTDTEAETYWVEDRDGLRLAHRIGNTRHGHIVVNHPSEPETP